MAHITCHYYSFTLKQNTDIDLIIPTPEGNEQITDVHTQKAYAYEEGLPVVYLLHGAYGNHSSWMRFSSIERYAQKHHCAIVMASAGNHFYQDMVHGSAYETFFTQELPTFIQSIFPVSKEREKTFIAGFSMGGYGAWYLALSHPHLYAKAASMSGALDIVQLYEDCKKGTLDAPFEWENIFGTPETLKGSTADLFTLINNLKKTGQLPELYLSCGTEDFLYTLNQHVKQTLDALDIPVTYEEGPGGHNWDFWDQYIQHILPWFLEK